MSEDPRMKDPTVPRSTKLALASKEAKRNRAMLKSFVLYTNEVGITDPEAMKRLKDFKRTLKPIDTSCDQARPSDVEFVFHLGSWNRAFVSVSCIQDWGPLATQLLCLVCTEFLYDHLWWSDRSLSLAKGQLILE